jgi:hypothetical protein
MLQPYQVQVYMRARKQGCTQFQSAVIAGFSERSGRRIESGERCANTGEERTWRTRPDPLAEVWESELELMLKQEPRLEAMTLYEYLVEKYPGQYEQTLRTVQRRVQAWKALYGDPKEVMFEIRHVPGEMGLSDFTELKDVTITIGGQAFEHILYHYRLAYSGWQYVQVIQGGESFIGLFEGLQNALFACGGVPQIHRTDSLSAAYRNMAGKRYKPLTQLYDQLCEHYRMRPTRNNTGIAHENGSIESPHGHFKRRLTQQRYLRGSFDFESVGDYQRFIGQVVTTLNGKCVTKYTEEKAHLQPLPRYRVADYEELLVRVSRYSTIEVRCVLYTVPSRLIGQQLTIRLYHDRLVGYLGKQQVVELARVRGASSGTQRRARCINYRHIIAGLRRKPRAFLYCTWQSEILPTEQWRTLWQQIGDAWEPDSAAKLIVEALYIAATQDKETAVADYLQVQLEVGSLTLAGLQQQFGTTSTVALPSSTVDQHPLSSYDQLLTSNDSNASSILTSDSSEREQSLSQSQLTPQATPSLPHAQPLAESGTEGDSRTVELCSVLARTLSIRVRPPLPSSDATCPPRGSTAARKKFYQL